MEHQYGTVIISNNKAIDLNKIKETLKYKDLIFLFVKRDFISKYKQTILGPMWAVIQPLLTTAVFIWLVQFAGVIFHRRFLPYLIHLSKIAILWEKFIFQDW